MGIIRIGQKGKDTFFYPGITPISSGEVKKREYTDDEKEKLIESIMVMPRSKRVSAMRSAGLEEEERALAEQMNEAAKPSVEEGSSDDVEVSQEKSTEDDGDMSGVEASEDVSVEDVLFVEEGLKEDEDQASEDHDATDKEDKKKVSPRKK